MHSFRVSSGNRYPEPFIPTKPWAKDRFTLALVDFSKGEAADASGRDHHPVLYGTQWKPVAGTNWRGPEHYFEKFEFDPIKDESYLNYYLTRAYGAALKSERRYEVQARLRRLLPYLQTIEPGTESEDKPWTKVVFNEKGSNSMQFVFDHR